MNDHNYQLDLNPDYGVAGFEEMADKLAVKSVAPQVVSYVVRAILRAREESKVTSRELVQRVWNYWHIKITGATVRKIVSAACVDAGIKWIASEGDGYFFALDPEQLRKTERQLTRRLLRITARLGACQEGIKELEHLKHERKQIEERLGMS